MQLPFEHSGFCNVHELPQLPQFALSFFVSAQYEPPSAPPSSTHNVCDERQLDAHFPPAHTSSVPHVFPHVPQFALSVCVFAQYGEPASGEHVVCPCAHWFEHAPILHTESGPHLLKHAPQFWLSLMTCAQNAAPASGTHGSSPCGQPPWHLPVTHASRFLHAAPHAPQFLLSVCVSTHVKLLLVVQTVASGAHSDTQLPFEQTLD